MVDTEFSYSGTSGCTKGAGVMRVYGVVGRVRGHLPLGDGLLGRDVNEGLRDEAALVGLYQRIAGDHGGGVFHLHVHVHPAPRMIIKFFSSRDKRVRRQSCPELRSTLKALSF